MTTICSAPTCGKTTTSTLKCPVCLKDKVENVFCNQTCFRSSWPVHKAVHKQAGVEKYDPFPTYQYSGSLRPVYPLTRRRSVPDSIAKPDYAAHGKPLLELKNDRLGKIKQYNAEQLEAIRKVARLGREILDVTASHIKVGVTTDELDRVLHEECIRRDCYPSPLNYYNFPKSMCSSVNEVICHGIPDQYELKDGDIINLDVSVYHGGYHADLNETYYVGDKAKCDPESVNLVETTRECLDLAIAAVKPGIAFRELGNIIEAHATKNNCSVVRSFVGHGIGELFHCQPNIAHYANNKGVGIAKPGMVFTIEPMLCAGSYRDQTWPDNWTAVTQDGKRLAQFEHMMVVTEDGVEVLSARLADSPGGKVERV